jgi:hypothetical protein
MNDRANNLPEIEMQLRSFAVNEHVIALNQLAKLDSSLSNSIHNLGSVPNLLIAIFKSNPDLKS